MLHQLLLIFHILIAFSIIGLVLIQHGKGAEVGAAFGSGASNTVFGSQGKGSFLTKLTTTLACCFAATSIGLSLSVRTANRPASLTERLEREAVSIIPEQPQATPTPNVANELPSVPREQSSEALDASKSAE